MISYLNIFLFLSQNNWDQVATLKVYTKLLLTPNCKSISPIAKKEFRQSHLMFAGLNY